MKYPVIISPTGPKTYCASSPDVPGCIATGRTVKETLTGYKRALYYHLKCMHEDGDPLPQPATEVATVEVEIPGVA